MDSLSNDSVNKFMYVTEQIKNNYGNDIFSEINKKKLVGLYKDFLLDDYESKKMSEFFVLNNGLKFLSEKKFKDFDTVFNFYFVSESILPNNELLGIKYIFGFKNKKNKEVFKIRFVNRKILLAIIITTTLGIISVIILANNVYSKREEKIQSETIPNIQRYVSVDNLNMRIGPGVEFDILSVLHINDPVSIIDDTSMNGWAYIEIAQMKGYVSNKYLSKEKVDVPKRDEINIIQKNLEKEEILPILDLSIKEIKE